MIQEERKLKQSQLKGPCPTLSFLEPKACWGRALMPVLALVSSACQALVNILDRWPERSGLGRQTVSGRPWA